MVAFISLTTLRSNSFSSFLATECPYACPKAAAIRLFGVAELLGYVGMGMAVHIGYKAYVCTLVSTFNYFGICSRSFSAALV